MVAVTALLTGHPTVDYAVTALRAAAAEFLLSRVRRALDQSVAPGAS